MCAPTGLVLYLLLFVDFVWVSLKCCSGFVLLDAICVSIVAILIEVTGYVSIAVELSPGLLTGYSLGSLAAILVALSNAYMCVSTIAMRLIYRS